MTPGDSEAGTVSVSVTGVVAVVVSSSEELIKEVVLEAEGLVVTGVCASCSPSAPSPSPSGSLLTPEGEGPLSPRHPKHLPTQSLLSGIFLTWLCLPSARLLQQPVHHQLVDHGLCSLQVCQTQRALDG